MRIRGRIKVGRRTKNLVPMLKPGDIAVICHPGLDGVAARSLLDRGVRAVINAVSSFSPKYVNDGPRILVEAGVALIDEAGEGVLDLTDGTVVEVRSGRIIVDDTVVASGKPVGLDDIEKAARAAKENAKDALLEFIDNTLTFANLEKHSLVSGLGPLPIRTPIKGRHVLVVIRGRAYKEDLETIRPYIKEVRPVLVGVDGGADAILELGFKPDVIVGDMDSVSDKALKCGAEVVVHAYPDGHAPGLERVRDLGLHPHVIPASGTSEDLALMLAFEAGACLIVAVGTHNSMADFLEKGRAGMASTLLTRIKVGPILVDAKGVSQIYTARVRPAHLLEVTAGALLALVVAATASPLTQTYLRLLCLRMRVGLGGFFH